jgi:putative AlgH/UPF0301 family transcriptional regulator
MNAKNASRRAMVLVLRRTCARSLRAGHGLLIGIAWLLATACAAHAGDSGDALLVIAAPSAEGLYRRTVLVALPVAGGHVGVMLNRQAVKPTDAFPFPLGPGAPMVEVPLRHGGPLGSKLLYALVRGDPGGGARRIFGNLFMVTGREAIERILDRDPRDARFFVGIVVWLPGELEIEIEDGKWIVASPYESVVFHPNPEAVWGELVPRLDQTAPGRTAMPIAPPSAQPQGEPGV